jgi:hypothetical protein
MLHPGTRNPPLAAVVAEHQLDPKAVLDRR